MDILYITDFSLEEAPGGAQRSIDFIIKHGEKIGHNITQLNYRSSPTALLKNYDAIITSNFEAIYRGGQSHVIEYVLKHPCHIRNERDSASYFSKRDRKIFFASTKLNIFLSDFHLSFFQDLYGDLFKNNSIVYPYIDTSKFKNKKNNKIYDILYCGYLHPLKGLHNMLNFAQQNPDRKITVFGFGDEKDVNKLRGIKNVDFMGKVGHDEVADIFNQSEYIFHDPEVNEPFCRMVGEAMLCGTKFIGNSKKIGAVQAINNLGLDQVREDCLKSNEIFWDLIENL